MNLAHLNFLILRSMTPRNSENGSDCARSTRRETHARSCAAAALLCQTSAESPSLLR